MGWYSGFEVVVGGEVDAVTKILAEATAGDEGGGWVRLGSHHVGDLCFLGCVIE